VIAASFIAAKFNHMYTSTCVLIYCARARIMWDSLG